MSGLPLTDPAWPAISAEKRAAIDVDIRAGLRDRAIVEKHSPLDVPQLRAIRAELAAADGKAPHLGSIISRITRVDKIVVRDWYIDTDSGNDVTGDGLSPATALYTYAELIKRWGPNAYVDGIHVVVHVNDWSSDPVPFDLDIAFANNGALSFVGDLDAYRAPQTPILSFTLPPLPAAVVAGRHAPVMGFGGGAPPPPPPVTAGATPPPVIHTDGSVVNFDGIIGELWEGGAARFSPDAPEPRARSMKAWALGTLGRPYVTAGGTGIPDVSTYGVATRPLGAWYRPNTPADAAPLPAGRIAPVRGSGVAGPPPAGVGWPIPRPSDPSQITTWQRTAPIGISFGSIRVRAHDQVGGTLQFVNFFVNAGPSIVAADPLCAVEFWQCRMQYFQAILRDGRIRFINCLCAADGWQVYPGAKVDVFGGAWLNTACDVRGDLFLGGGAIVGGRTSVRDGARLVLGDDGARELHGVTFYDGDVDSACGMLWGPNYADPHGAIAVDGRGAALFGGASLVYGQSSFVAAPGAAIQLSAAAKWHGHVDYVGTFRAFDESAGGYTEARTLGAAAFDALVSAGGFEGAAHDPRFGTIVVRFGS